jgi:hypothetical protein
MANNKLKGNFKSARTKVAPEQPSLKQIIRKLRRHLPQLHRRYKVSYLGVFGSWVHGEQRKRSDLDILVEFDEAPSFFEFIRLENALSDLLNVRKVDLVMKSALKPIIGRHILEEVVPV